MKEYFKKVFKIRNSDFWLKQKNLKELKKTCKIFWLMTFIQIELLVVYLYISIFFTYIFNLNVALVLFLLMYISNSRQIELENIYFHLRMKEEK